MFRIRTKLRTISAERSSYPEHNHLRKSRLHIEHRRGTLKRFKNGGKCLLNFVK
jgi:hypothetical protein